MPNKIRLPVYLDQCVISRLQPDSPERDDLLATLKLMAEKGATFVYSWLNVEEARSSDRPEIFVVILEELSAWLLEPSGKSDGKATLSHDRARELILAENGPADDAMRVMEDLLKPLHFSTGWLGDMTENDLRADMLADMEAFWTSMETELPTFTHGHLRLAGNNMSNLIQDIPLERLKIEQLQWQSELRQCLPQNPAQLDQVPAAEAVDFLLASMDERARAEISGLYPQGFWASPTEREDGTLTSFAFMLFMMGLVRDKRTRTKGLQRRQQHFRGQFRDCHHIELASVCPVFATWDKGAARLAKTAYSYAGAITEVLHISKVKG
ncbi:hypothetical protein M3484_08435 [Pseudomonas sp. GX19020]|uniref:hypothetical protein n=1 Tax=Pseudomonas sp. GX19020 TaxID=2942277 RepID=UPI0020188408|nr:hypothetical protein [Pseudomonas sp. GX19020]MCL4066598.1 hypothetical protein [Pseudomonas sp. GX19020]